MSFRCGRAVAEADGDCAEAADRPPPREAKADGTRQLLLVEGVVWFIAVKWSFIFGALGLEQCTSILMTHWVTGLLPMLYLTGVPGLTRRALAPCSDSDLQASAMLFGAMTVSTAVSLHISLGGWTASAYLAMWCPVGFMIPILYDCPPRLMVPAVCVLVLVLMSDMLVEFKAVEALPLFVAESMRAISRCPRGIVPLEPVGLPPHLYPWVAANNFFTALGIITWALFKVTHQRRVWQGLSDQLINNLIPPVVADELRRGAHRSELTRGHKGVTCFFSDVVGYTAMCDRMHNPAKVMVVLDLMYQAFDTMAEMTGAYKVETIGDAYFAVTGLCLTSTRGTPASQSEEESCYRMVLFARCVREFMLGPFGRSYGIRMRIGLHTGDVVTGVLGELRPRMVVVGDTVNVASRMETAAEANSINLSHTSADLLREHFELQARNPEEIKGKGVFQMYELGEPKFTYCPFGLPTPEHIVECAYRGLRECKERAEIDNQSLDQYCSPELTNFLSRPSLGTPLSRPFRTSYRAFPYGLVAE